MGYLQENVDSLWYRQRLAAGRPIGTGLIEGGCKTIVSNRLKLNSARWTPRHAEQMAALRCLDYSGLWKTVLGHPSRLSAYNISYTPRPPVPLVLLESHLTPWPSPG